MLNMVVTGCVNTNGPSIKNKKGTKSVAVAYIYNEENGDITDLGNAYRDRIERDFKNRGFDVKVRKEIVFLIEDTESFGAGIDESHFWEKAGADIVVCGNYRIIPPLSSKKQSPTIKVTVKAFEVTNSSLLDSYVIQEELKPGWLKQASAVKGNVHQKDLENVSVGSGGQNQPLLEVDLDRDPACYPPGSNAWIQIKTEPGIYLYIFNILADQTVSLLYPNTVMPEQPLPQKEFAFPPKALSDRLQLQLFPLEPEKPCSESFKIIAARDRIDFSFLPVPKNQIYKGAEGGDIRKIVERLKTVKSYSEKSISYWVGKECSQ